MTGWLHTLALSLKQSGKPCRIPIELFLALNNQVPGGVDLTYLFIHTVSNKNCGEVGFKNRSGSRR